MTKIQKQTLIGKPITKMDAPNKVTGKVRYINELEVHGMLHGKILRTDRVHAKILSIDTSAAEALLGVHAVITWKDTPCIEMGHGKDNLPLKKDRVRCTRDEIAAVAADTEEIAEQALQLIKVEYEDLPAIFDPEDSLKEGAPVIHDKHPKNTPFIWNYDNGDIEIGEAESDFIVEDTFHLHFMTHCCMGVSGVLAEFDAEGKLKVHSQTQVPYLYKKDIAKIIDIPAEHVHVIQPVLGGGFGSKLDIYPFEPICIFLARKAKRPVRLIFDREEEFIASPTRQPALMKLRSGVKKDGTLTFREVNTLLDNGGYTSWGATTPFVMMQTFSSLYRVPHCKYQTKVVYTNNVFSGSFRGYGNLQATFALESQMDRLAVKCGLNPLEIRKKNAQHPGEITPQGLNYSTCGFQECIDVSTNESRFLEKYQQNLTAQQDKRSHIKKGIGMASLLHVGGGAKIYGTDGCGTILKFDDFCNVTIITGSSEIGQGSETVLSQFVGDILGLPVSKMKVVNNDTDVCPWDVGVHASRTTFVAGNSAIRAANKAKTKILTAAAEQYDVKLEELDLRGEHIVMDSDGEVVINLGKFIRALHFSTKFDLIMTTDYYEPPSVSQDKGFKGNVSASYAFGTQVIEIEVDTDTGVITVDKVTAAHDVGKVINPLGIEGQLEGGIVMGVGYAMTEQLLLKEGKVQNPNFRDYKLITAPEIPEMDMHFIETNDPEGPCGAKGMGEAPAIPTAAAIGNALFNATGVHFRDLPLTPEKVLQRLKQHQQENS